MRLIRFAASFYPEEQSRGFRAAVSVFPFPEFAGFLNELKTAGLNHLLNYGFLLFGDRYQRLDHSYWNAMLSENHGSASLYSSHDFGTVCGKSI
jgi:hypothetical protein